MWITHWGRDKMATISQTTFSMQIFLNENVGISIKISLKSVPKSPIVSIAALVQVMAWRWPGGKPLLDQWWTNDGQITDIYMPSLSLNEIMAVGLDVTIMSHERCVVSNHLQLNCLLNSVLVSNKENIDAPYYLPFMWKSTNANGFPSQRQGWF